MPPPFPQAAVLHIGVRKLVDVCVVHADQGVPASNVPSVTRSVGVQVGVGDAVGLFVGVPVGVLVAVAVGVFVGVPGVGVLVGVPVGPPLQGGAVDIELRGTGAVTTSKSRLLLSVSWQPPFLRTPP